MRILVTGGCGFVGSSIAVFLKKTYAAWKIIVIDNLKRRGSELNIQRLKQHGIEFIHGDIRNKEDLELSGVVDIIIECSAEPSVLAGYDSPAYLINTNLVGTINCLEIARKYKAVVVFLSTSRVYPFGVINNFNYTETESRYDLQKEQVFPGVSIDGFTEKLSMEGPRSLYGATKYCSEVLIQEYIDMYGIKAIINRCGVITGPWQFGKVDQGFIVLWLAKHYWKESLSYLGFGGKGKQVRDILHIEDLSRLIDLQINNIDLFNKEVFNVGGGRSVSVSLKELTQYCENVTGNRIKIERNNEMRKADIILYITDNAKVTEMTGWKPIISAEEIVQDVFMWINNNEHCLKGVLN